MQAGLVGYFDLGSTAAVTDAALGADLRRRMPEIGMVGLLNPLGQGTGVDLLGSRTLDGSVSRMAGARHTDKLLRATTCYLGRTAGRARR